MAIEVEDRDTGIRCSCCSIVIFCVIIATFLAAFAALGLAIDNHLELKKLKAECMREVMPSTNMDTADEERVNQTQLERMMDRQDTMLKQLTQLDTRYNIINESIRSLSSRVDEIRSQIDILSASHTTPRAVVNTTVLADFDALGTSFNTLNMTALSAISQLDSITTKLTRLNASINKSIHSLRLTVDERDTATRTQIDIISATLRAELNMSNADTEERVSNLETMTEQQIAQLDMKFNQSISFLHSRDNAITNQIDTVSASLTTLRAEVNMSNAESEERVSNLETMTDQQIAQLDMKFNQSISLLTSRAEERGNAITNQIDAISASLTTLKAEINMSNADTEEQVSSLETRLQDQQDTVVQELTQIDARLNTTNESIHLLSLTVDERDDAIRTEINIVSASLTTLRAEVNVSEEQLSTSLQTTIDKQVEGLTHLHQSISSLGSRLDERDHLILTHINNVSSSLACLRAEVHANVSIVSANFNMLNTTASSRLNKLEMDSRSLNSRIDSTNKRINNYHSSGYIPRPSVVSIFITLVTAHLSVH